MKAASIKSLRNNFLPAFVLSALLGFGLAVSGPAVSGQQAAQLSLADILIALRSKKVTLPERNKILTEAINTRGITFSLTTEIEKELEATGADQALIDSIRKRSTIVKTSAVVMTPAEAKPNPVPVASPAQDFNFFLKRGETSSAKGDLDSALVDFGKAIELKPDSFDAYLYRGMAHLTKKALELAVADLGKAIELNPNSASAYAQRGNAFELKGDTAKAKADYQKATELDANIEPAKSSLARIVADELKAKQAEDAKKLAEAPPPVKAAPKPAPEFVDLGQIMVSLAVKMVTPSYPPAALRSGIQGKVKVEVEINENGDVTSTKAVEGHQFLRMNAEDAASRSKFKPATYEGKPIKSRGYIIYNFTPTGR
jgi:TonB family protein